MSFLFNSLSALSELGDINLTSIAEGNLLQYDSASGKWVNRTLGAVADAGYVNISGDTMTGSLGLGVNNLTLTGSIASTGSRVLKGWFTDIESTNTPTVGGVPLSTFTPSTIDTDYGIETVSSAWTMNALTLGGNLVAGDFSLTGIDTLTFTDINGTIAGIENQNLVDKSATESISGLWTFTSQLTVSGANLSVSVGDIYLDRGESIFFDQTAGAGGDTPGKIGISGTNAGTNNFLTITSNLGSHLQIGRVGGNARVNIASGTHSVHVDNGIAYFGTGEDAGIRYSTSQTPDSWQFGVSADSRAMLLIELADFGAFDFGHALQTNPTLFIHSANQSTTQWLSLTHNATDGVIDCGTGTLNLGGTANVNFAGATRTASTVVHDAYVTLEIGGVAYKFMLGA